MEEQKYIPTSKILMRNMKKLEEGKKRVSSTREDIWQDDLIYWICKPIIDLMLYVFTIKPLKGDEQNGCGN